MEKTVTENYTIYYEFYPTNYTIHIYENPDSENTEPFFEVTEDMDAVLMDMVFDKLAKDTTEENCDIFRDIITNYYMYDVEDYIPSECIEKIVDLIDSYYDDEFETRMEIWKQKEWNTMFWNNIIIGIILNVIIIIGLFNEEKVIDFENKTIKKIKKRVYKKWNLK